MDSGRAVELYTKLAFGNNYTQITTPQGYHFDPHISEVRSRFRVLLLASLTDLRATI